MKRLNVLVVDDNVRNRFLLSEMVTDMGHHSEIAENGQIALDKISQTNFDIILLDVEMPVMNGIETAIHIRTKLKPPHNNMPIIFITAHNVDDYFTKDAAYYYNDIITKPYSVDSLVKILEKYFSE